MQAGTKARRQDLGTVRAGAAAAGGEGEAGRAGVCKLQGTYVVRTMAYGNSQHYLLRRLARDRPDILERVKAGEFESARAAAIEAGIIKPVPTVRKSDSAEVVFGKLLEILPASTLEELAELMAGVSFDEEGVQKFAADRQAERKAELARWQAARIAIKEAIRNEKPDLKTDDDVSRFLDRVTESLRVKNQADDVSLIPVGQS